MVAVAAAVAAPKLLRRRQSKFYVPNPAWVNAPYEILVWRPHEHIGTVVWKNSIRRMFKRRKFPSDQGLTK